MQETPDNPPAPNQSPATDPPVHRERRRDVAAYLVCSGFPCTGYDGVCYTFDDPSGEVCFKRTGYNDIGATVEPQPFLNALAELKRMTERWEREHFPSREGSSEDFFIPFQLKHLSCRKEIGTAIWLYLWCIAKTTAEYLTDIPGQRIGIVNYGHHVKDGDLAKFFGCETRTIHTWRSLLESQKRIKTSQNMNGCLYAVIDSRKLNHKKAKDGPAPDWTKVPAPETCEVS